MLFKLKAIFLNVCLGASAAIGLLMVVVGYSDRIHPESHPTLACAGMIFPLLLAANVVALLLWVLFKWRKAWIQLAALLLAFPAIRVYLPLHLQGEPPEGSIKIISYNVACYGVKDHCDNPVDSIRRYLEQQDADIVCLQEDAPRRAANSICFEELYPYNDTVHVNRPGSPYINAIGVHTRYPILRKERLGYDAEANGSAAFYLLIDGDTVIVVNNHLESTHLTDNDRKEYTDIIYGDVDRRSASAGTRKLLGKVSAAMVKRSHQAELVHDYIVSHSQYPLIVCGDFNDTPISYVRRTVAKGLVDCYVESGCGLGFSYNRKGFFFRIDQLMCSHHFKPYNTYVDSHVAASDHYPVVGWLKRQ